MLNYYAAEKVNQHRIADMQRTAADERLAKLATTPQPRHIGRTRAIVGQFIIRLGTRIAAPVPALTPQPEQG